mgnify:CR=1 FL=1
MKELTRTECADWLLDRDHFVILTHRKPDGDTIGSAVGLCLGLRQLGKTAHVLENPEITPLYAPLLTKLTKSTPQEGDLLIAVDVAADTMLPRNYEDLKYSVIPNRSHICFSVSAVCITISRLSMAQGPAMRNIVVRV